MEITVNIFFILAITCLIVHLFSLLVVLARKYRAPRGIFPNWADQKVTILRPVAGLENNLEATLASAFELNHPCYEIIFCVAKDNDPVIPLCQKLMAQYPNVDARLLIGDDAFSSNPKLNNVAKGWQAAQYDWIAMVDSNILMPKDYFKRIFARWKNDTGLVSSPPLGIAPENFAADVEAAFLNSYQARWQLTADTIGNGFAQGKTLFFQRETLEKAGGIQALTQELAEDAAATKIIRQQKRRVRLTAMPFSQPLGKKTLKSVWQRQLRWAKLRRDSFALFFYLEIFSGVLFPACCLLVACLLSQTSLWFIAGYFAIWYASEFAIAAIVAWPSSLRQLVAMFYRDALLIVLWFSAFKKGGYQWQGHKVEMDKK